MDHKEIRKIAFKYVPETCPAVDLHIDETIDTLIGYFGEQDAEYITDQLDELRDLVKADGTILLRGGLIEAIADYEQKLREVIDGG